MTDAQQVLQELELLYQNCDGIRGKDGKFLDTQVQHFINHLSDLLNSVIKD